MSKSLQANHTWFPLNCPFPPHTLHAHNTPTTTSQAEVTSDLLKSWVLATLSVPRSPCHLISNPPWSWNIKITKWEWKRRCRSVCFFSRCILSPDDFGFSWKQMQRGWSFTKGWRWGWSQVSEWIHMRLIATVPVSAESFLSRNNVKVCDGTGLIFKESYHVCLWCKSWQRCQM